jgi:hypothetical protein
MKKSLLVFLVLITIQTVGMAQFKDPNAQVREAKNFHGIRVSNAFDVFLSQGNEEAVAVSASEDRLLDKIIVEVNDGILNISFAKGFKLNLNGKKLKAYISFKTIDKLFVSGACNIKIEGTIKADDLHIKLSGASDLKGKVEATKLKINQSGASDMIMGGMATNLDVSVSGASDFKGFELMTDYCIAVATGSSDLQIRVNKELAVRATGSSDIDYRGDAVIRDIKTSGSSNVTKRDKKAPSKEGAQSN